MPYHTIGTAAGGRAAVLHFCLQGDVAGCGLSSINVPTLSPKDLKQFTHAEIEEYVITAFANDVAKAGTAGRTSAFVLVEAWNGNSRNPIHKVLQTGKAGQIVSAPWVANSMHTYTAVRPYIWIPYGKAPLVVDESSTSGLREQIRAFTA